MAKTKKSAGAPAWMVTFADLMALLLTLFVLLLSFADMDAKRYKQLAGTMRDAFGLAHLTRLAGMMEIDGTAVRDRVAVTVPVPEPVEALPSPPPSPKAPKESKESKMETPESWELRSLKAIMADEIAGGDMEIEQKEGKVVIRFPEKTTFPPGTDSLSKSFLPILKKLSGVLARSAGRIIVSGHTDDIPISTERFRSNWDLSSARAVSVVHQLLAFAAIDPARITVQGFGASRPLAPNDTPENRALNRRIEISVEVR